MPNWKKLIVSGSDASLSTLTITNSGSTADSLLLTATEDSSTAAPVATFKRNSSSPGDADYLGQLKFKGENDADQEVVYAKITAKIQDASDGSEDGLIEFANKKAGSNNITARLKSDKLQLINGTELEVDGKVGIGSTDPNNNLHIQADANGEGLTIQRASSTEDAFGELAFLQSTSAGADPNLWIRGYRGSDFGSSYLTVGTNNTERIRIDSNGNIGIGTTSLSNKLDVQGTVSASAFIGDGSGLTNVTSNITEEVTVSQTFTSATTASVNHLFGTKDVIVTVYDDNDDQFIPSRINTPDTNNVNIFMDPATTGRVVVAKGGHLVSGSIHKHLMTSVTSSTITHNLQEEFPVVQVYESASREMFIPETIKSIDQNNTQVVLSELIDCYVVIKR